MGNAKPSPVAAAITYEAGKVQRYHTHPRLARLGQTDADHSWGVAALILQLHPDPSKELLAAAILHDTGERFAGDIPAPVKKDNPDLAKAHALLEDLMRQTFVFRGDYNLNAIDARWLKLCDMLECILFVSVTLPDVLKSKPWLEFSSVIRSSHLDPSPLVSVSEVIDAAIYRQGCEEAPTRNSYSLRGDAA